MTPTHMSGNQRFIEGEWFNVSADGTSLLGSRCEECSEVFFPKRLICPLCIKEDTLKEIKLSPKGKIFSYSVLHVSLPGFPAPYIIGRVELPEGPRVASLITGCEAVKGVLEIGDEVELVIGEVTKDKEGVSIIGYSFRPLKDQKGTENSR